MGDLIPLFPLGTPLFPGVVLPLHIFEPRYRRMMQDLLSLPEAGDRRFFGVVAIRQGWEVERIAPAEALYDIGCTAQLRRIGAQADGGFAIVTVGADRFRLLDVVVGDEPPYLQAEVEWLADEEAAEEAAGDTDGLVIPHPGPVLQGPLAAGEGAEAPRDDVVASVARSSLELLAHGVSGLLARYVAELSALGAVGDEAEVAELLQEAQDPTALSWLVAAAAQLTTEDRQALLAESATRRRLAIEARVLRRELILLQTLRAVPVPLHSFATPMTVN
jgi:Lon protease-like protein